MNRMLSLAAVAVLAAGCTFNVEAASQEKQARYDRTDFDALVATWDDLPDGLAIHGRDEPGAAATASVVGLVAPGEAHRLDDARLDFVKRGGALELRLRAPGDRESLRFEWVDAQVVRAADLDVALENGDIEIGGMRGRVHAVAENGDLRVATSGPIDLRAENGDIRATGSSGTVVAENGNASVRMQREFGDMRVESENGNVTVRVPRGAGCRLDLATENGTVRVRAGGVRVTRESGFYAVLGGDGPTIRVRAENGDVTVIDDD